ncbi:MAG TPA: LCP family protein [Rhodoglobus sp.]|nr:LCP family protein [Rhodoglobus sp.]
MSAAASPVRNPDLKNTPLMTKRAWILVALNVLIPGSPQLIAGNRRLGRFGVGATFLLWALVLAGVVLFFVAQSLLITVATNWWALWVIQALIVFYVVLWVILTLDTLRLVRLVRVDGAARGFVAGLSVILLVVIGGAGAYGAMIAGSTRDTVGAVFADGQIEPPIDGRYNILLLGGDAGPDREGLRPDSISVASIDAETGETVIFGLPRNMEYMPFPEDSPMFPEYPNGYGADVGCYVDVCYLNSVYTEVELYLPDYYPDAVANGSRPGIEGTKDAVEGVLGLQIQYYAMIDMAGFEQLINALGGIEIDVKERLPIGGDEDEFGNPINVGAWLEPGVQRLDGNRALWYARSRHGTSDYDRMSRQREVQEAILRQFEPSNVLARFQEVAAAGTQVVTTNIPQPMLGAFTQLALKARDHEVVDIDFVPANGFDPEFPDYAYIRQVVADAVAPPVEEPAE